MAEQTFEAGNLRFAVEHRAFGGDGGPALRVLGPSAGRTVELLRFDCFEKGPHYHYAPSGKDERISLDPASDTVAWTIARLRDGLQEMLARAGTPDLAREVDVEAVRQVLPQVEAAMRGG